jgi:tellurite resistance protein TehA-like permease
MRHPASPFEAWLASIAPGGFAIVMATGIVSIAARLVGRDAIGWTLCIVNFALYPAMWLALFIRLASTPRAVLAALISHDRGPGYLTTVAATAVLGSQCAVYGIAPGLLPWLLGLAAMLWAALLYAFLAGITLQAEKPAVRDGLNGSWLLVVVATESLAVLGSYVAPLCADPAPVMFLSLAAFLLGGMLYVLLAALITYRFVFMTMSADELETPWWINMGAVAIATLAGSRMMLLPTFDAHVAALRTIAGPITVLFWATATFWIPLLVVLFAWKHVVQREPVRYEPGQWSLVFPLGMYTASTAVFSHAAGLAFLRAIPTGFFWLALLAWALAAFGLARAIGRSFAR